MPKNMDNLNYWMRWIESTPDVIFMKDLEGVYRGLSKSTAVLAGFNSAEEMIGKTDFDIYQKESAETFVAQDKIVMETGKESLVEDWLEHPTKGLIKIETLKAPLYDEEGVLIGIQGISRDITQKYNYEKTIRTQQAQLTAVIDNIPFPIWLKDTNGNYLLVNKSYGDSLSLSKSDLVGSSPIDLARRDETIDKEIAKQFVEEDRRIIEDKVVVHSSNHVNYHGQEFYLEITKSPVFDGEGNVIGIAGISVDVTAHKAYEDELMNAKKIAELANKTKSEFLANMSHEIRTPMNGVMGFIQLLSDTDLNEEQKDYVEEAKKSSEILLKLLNDILDLSKIEAGKMTMENISFNIRYVVEDVATLASSNAAKKGIEINALCHSNIPERVIGDPGRLKQILNNFVNNAVKFTEEGEINLSVKLLEQEENRVKFLFEVEDTGIGISEEHKSKIFEAFTQADSSTTRKYGGTGLGLTISKNIVEMMNGEIWVESEPDSGSKFSFTGVFEIDETIEEKEKPSNRKQLENLNLLIVDDNKTNLKVLSHYLGEFGIKTIEAMNANEAMKMLTKSKQKIDIVLTDYCMPFENGIELTNNIHKIEKYKNLPIVLLTSRAQRGDYRAVKENNLRGYLPKPIRRNDLIECISMIVSESKDGLHSDKEVITRHTIKEKHMTEDIKILLVEDVPLNQKLTIKMMNKAGYSCDVANNGTEAIHAFENKKYDMIFMDCQMPVMDGYTATAKIRKIEKEKKLKLIPIIALTANAMHGDVKDCEKAGMNDYIPKPIHFETLTEKIKKYSPDEVDVKSVTKKVDRKRILSHSKLEIIESVVTELGIDESDAKELLDGFLADSKKMLEDLDNAFAQKDFEAIEDIAHSIKGASGNLRINSIYELTMQIISRAKTKDISGIDSLIDAVKAEFFALS